MPQLGSFSESQLLPENAVLTKKFKRRLVVKKGLKWIGAVLGILLVALLAFQKAEALSYPSISPDNEMTGATLNLGDTASFGFMVYPGSYQTERYFAEVYYKDRYDELVDVEYTDDYLSGSTTNFTLSWVTGEYGPGLYTIEVWTEYYDSGNGWVESPQQRKTFTVKVIGVWLRNGRDQY